MIYNNLNFNNLNINLKKDFIINNDYKNKYLFHNVLKKIKKNKNKYFYNFKNYKNINRNIYFFKTILDNKKHNIFLKKKKINKYNKFYKKLYINKYNKFFFLFKNLKKKKRSKIIYNNLKIIFRLKAIRFIGYNFKYSLKKYKNYKIKNILFNKKYFLFYNFFKNIRTYKKYFLLNKIKNLKFINNYNIDKLSYYKLIQNINYILFFLNRILINKKFLFNLYFNKNFFNFNILNNIKSIFKIKRSILTKHKYILYDLSNVLKKNFNLKKIKIKKKNIYFLKNIFEYSKKYKRFKIINNYLNNNSNFNNIKSSIKNNYNNLNFLKKNNFLIKNLKKFINLKNNIKLLRKNFNSLENNLIILLYKTTFFKTFNEIKNELSLNNIKIIKKNNKILILKISSLLKNKLILRFLNNIKSKNHLKKIPNYIEIDFKNFYIIFNLSLINDKFKNTFIKNILLNNNNINIIKFNKNKSLKLNKFYKNL